MEQASKQKKEYQIKDSKAFQSFTKHTADNPYVSLD